MKKFLLCFLFSFVCIISNAQIYNTIKYLDKFDDVIKQENVKTLITIHNIDSTNFYNIDGCNIIEVETKGKSPVKYISICKVYNGNNNDIIKLIDDIFGYETEYYCIKYEKLKKEIDNIIINTKHKSDSITNELLNRYNISKNEEVRKKSEEFRQQLEENTIQEFILSLRIHFLNTILDKEALKNDEFILVDRTITTEYTHSFLTRLFWIKFNDNKRIIFKTI